MKQSLMRLEADPRIKLMPEGQSLIEFISRAAPDVLDAATSQEDFQLRMAAQIMPFHSDLGPLRLDLIDHEGNPSDMANDECTIVVVSLGSLVH